MVASRRRSLKKKKMVGGLENTFYTQKDDPFSTYEKLEKYIDEGRNDYFPIFSQKRGICVTDSTLNIFWWAEGIRETFWKKEVYDNGGRYTTCVDTAAGRQVCAEQGSTVRLTPEEAATLLAKISLHRLVNIMGGDALRVNPTTNLLKRSESTALFSASSSPATGEVCANYFLSFADYGQDKSVQPRQSRGYYGVNPGIIKNALETAFRVYGIADRTYVLNITNSSSVQPGYTAVAVTIYAPYTSGGHETSAVLIGDVWHYCDNEIGMSVPMIRADGTKITTDDVLNGTFEYQYVLPNSIVVRLSTRYGSYVWDTAIISPREENFPGNSPYYTEDLPGRFVVLYRFDKQRALSPVIQGVNPLFSRRDLSRFKQSAEQTDKLIEDLRTKRKAASEWSWQRWANRSDSEKKAIDTFLASSECFPGYAFGQLYADAENPDVWMYGVRATGKIEFIASVAREENGQRYISWVCTGAAVRGKGILGEFFRRIASHYGRTQSFSLIAANTADNNLNQTKRIKIYAKYGFRVVPGTKITTTTGDPQTLSLIHI